jgi:hypothetical protein
MPISLALPWGNNGDDEVVAEKVVASLERWETVTEGPARKGARYTVHCKIGWVPIRSAAT